MNDSITKLIKQVFALRWRPDRDLAAVAVSWLLVVCTLYTASVIVGPDLGDGLPHFLLYAVATATLFGIGIPLYWMVIVRRRPLADLGITTHRLGLNVVFQLIFAALLYLGPF